VKRPGSSLQAGTLIVPWQQPEPPPDPRSERSSPPRKYEPPHLTRFRERLASGREKLPTVASTVTARPASARVDRALGSLRIFDAIETPATAYDATIAVGPEQLVVATNFTVAVLGKAGGPPIVKISRRAWFGSLLPPAVDFVFDPRVLYDQHEGRWVLVASGAHEDGFTSGIQLLSVSRTSDPRGEWWIWAFPEAGGVKGRWPDHPSLGVDAHALYLSANLFLGLSNKPVLGRLRVIPKAGPYAGGVVPYTDFEELQNPVDTSHPAATNAQTVFPCHTGGPPASST
jgi:hypothetical protein